MRGLVGWRCMYRGSSQLLSTQPLCEGILAMRTKPIRATRILPVPCSPISLNLVSPPP